MQTLYNKTQICYFFRLNRVYDKKKDEPVLLSARYTYGVQILYLTQI